MSTDDTKDYGKKTYIAFGGNIFNFGTNKKTLETNPAICLEMSGFTPGQEFIVKWGKNKKQTMTVIFAGISIADNKSFFYDKEDDREMVASLYIHNNKYDLIPI